MSQVKDDRPVPEEVIRRQTPEAQEIIRLLLAVVSVMMALFRHGKSRTALLLDKLFEVPASPGWIVKLQNQALEALRPCDEELEQALPSSVAVIMFQPTFQITPAITRH